jgi:hypothetical protein
VQTRAVEAIHKRLYANSIYDIHNNKIFFTLIVSRLFSDVSGTQKRRWRVLRHKFTSEKDRVRPRKGYSPSAVANAEQDAENVRKLVLTQCD